MSKMTPEEEMKFYHRFVLTCKKCGHKFLPWRSFGLTSEKTGWKPGFFCPNCQKLATKDEYISEN